MLSRADFLNNTLGPGGISQPRYGSDCSGYASVALEIERINTRNFHNDIRFPRVGNTNDTPWQSLARLSPGDLINTYANHVVIVERLEPIVNANGITAGIYVHVLEQTPPRTRSHRWSIRDLNQQMGGWVPRVSHIRLEQDYSWQWHQ